MDQHGADLEHRLAHTPETPGRTHRHREQTRPKQRRERVRHTGRIARVVEHADESVDEAQLLEHLA